VAWAVSVDETGADDHSMVIDRMGEGTLATECAETDHPALDSPKKGSRFGSVAVGMDHAYDMARGANGGRVVFVIGPIEPWKLSELYRSRLRRRLSRQPRRHNDTHEERHHSIIHGHWSHDTLRRPASGDRWNDANLKSEIFNLK
jgi:hypothetical protein